MLARLAGCCGRSCTTATLNCTVYRPHIAAAGSPLFRTCKIRLHPCIFVLQHGGVCAERADVVSRTQMFVVQGQFRVGSAAAAKQSMPQLRCLFYGACTSYIYSSPHKRQ